MKINNIRAIPAFFIALLPLWMFIYAVIELATVQIRPELPASYISKYANPVNAYLVGTIVTIVFTVVFFVIYRILVGYFSDILLTGNNKYVEIFFSKYVILITGIAYFILLLITAYNNTRVDAFETRHDDYFKNIMYSWQLVTISLPSMVFLMPASISGLVRYFNNIEK